MEKYGVGSIFKTKEGYFIEVVKKLDASNRVIRFLDSDTEIKVSLQHLSVLNIRNPYKKSVYETGFLGVGEYTTGIGGKHTAYYVIWREMLRRCYSDKDKIKTPTYNNCKVCDEWLNFQNFAKWYNENYPHHIENIKFELDKDLLQMGVENKIYSPETCVFLPKNVNVFLSNSRHNNTSGYTGVSWHKNSKKWYVKINEFNGKKSKNLGSFLEIDDARIAYDEARKTCMLNVKYYLKSLDYLDEQILNYYLL